MAINFFEAQRNALNISQRQMAKRLDVSNTLISALEQDRRVPRVTVAKLAKAYEVTETRMERELMALRRRIEANWTTASA